MDMTTFQILTLFGVSSIIGSIYALIMRSLKRTATKMNAVCLGVQAVLRSQMIDDYNKWSERGYAPIYAKENFENCWNQYEALGANGVMNNIRQKFLALPDRKPEV